MKINMEVARIFIGVCVIGISTSAIGDDIGIGSPGNGINDANDPNNDGSTAETIESGSTVETWWNELLEDLGFVTPDDEAGVDKE